MNNFLCQLSGTEKLSISFTITATTAPRCYHVLVQAKWKMFLFNGEKL